MFIETMHSIEDTWLQNLKLFCLRLLSEEDKSAKVATNVKRPTEEDVYFEDGRFKCWWYEDEAVKAASLLKERLRPFFSINPVYRVAVTVCEIVLTSEKTADVWLEVSIHQVVEVQATVDRPAAKLIDQK